MTLSVSTKQLKVLVTGCVKQQLFWRVKFFDDDLHGQFDHHPDSVCGMVRKYCNVSAIKTNLNWWYETRGKIKRTLGNHRNNCIKTMRLPFCGKLIQWLGNNNTLSHLCCLSRWRTWQDKWLQKIHRKWRRHCIHVANVPESGPLHILDWRVCPCIVSSSVWNNDALMAKYCGDNEQNFQEHVLTISDKTFLLLVLLNYAARWSAEVHLETKLVSQLCW
jgi:hypothetical protein